jgi:hypothetical protein
LGVACEPIIKNIGELEAIFMNFLNCEGLFNSPFRCLLRKPFAVSKPCVRDRVRMLANLNIIAIKHSPEALSYYSFAKRTTYVAESFTIHRAKLMDLFHIVYC